MEVVASNFSIVKDLRFDPVLPNTFVDFLIPVIFILFFLVISGLGLFVYFFFGCGWRKFANKQCIESCGCAEQYEWMSRLSFVFLVDIPFVAFILLTFNGCFFACFFFWKIFRIDVPPEIAETLQDFMTYAFYQIIIFSVLSIPFFLVIVAMIIILTVFLFFCCYEQSCNSGSDFWDIETEGLHDFLCCDCILPFCNCYRNFLKLLEDLARQKWMKALRANLEKTLKLTSFFLRDSFLLVIEFFTCFKRKIRQDEINNVDMENNEKTALLQLEKSSIVCPITMEIFEEPVINATGNTYEKRAIKEWLSKSNTDPLTNQILESKKLIPNRIVKTIVDDVLKYNTNNSVDTKKISLEPQKEKNVQEEEEYEKKRIFRRRRMKKEQEKISII